MPHFEMDEQKIVVSPPKNRLLYKVVLTGGPCGGKTTGQARLCTFFENLGWKVFRVPETASVLLGGGIKFLDLDLETSNNFQENLLKSMIQIENTFFELGEKCTTNCLIICDRGVMDVSAYMARDEFDKIMDKNKFNLMEYRDNRYNQIVHMVSAANGAEEFYTTEDHSCRYEDVENARIADYRTSSAWLGHPYYDVIDNSSDFESKICRLIATICQKVGVDPGDRLSKNSKKRKWLIKLPLPTDQVYPSYKDFDVVHNYIQMKRTNIQARLRKRGQNGQFMYTHTIRRPIMCGQIIEVRTQLTHRDYINMLSQRDDAHFTIYKKRRSFIHNNQYFQLDVYCEPCHPRCKGLVLLETYSALSDEELWPKLPSFLIIDKEVTGNPDYSMFNLSLREEWDKSDKFCKALEGSSRMNGKGHVETNNNNYTKCVIPNGGSNLNQDTAYT